MYVKCCAYVYRKVVTVLGTGNVKGNSKGFTVLPKDIAAHAPRLVKASPLMLIDTEKRKEHNIGRGWFGIKLQYHTEICVALSLECILYQK